MLAIFSVGRQLGMLQIFEKLAQIYDDLSKSFPKLDHNPCGKCDKLTVCCRADVIASHNISGLELTYLHHVYPEKDINAFKEFILRKKDTNGNLIHIHCPFYSKTENGCMVYKARPFSCRLFGPYFMDNTSVPAYCGFKNIGKYFKRLDYFVVVPEARAFSELKTLFYSRWSNEQGVHLKGVETKPVPGAGAVNDDELLLESGDPFTRGKILHNKGRYEEALAEYLKAKEACEGMASYHLHLACLYQDMGKNEEAIISYNNVFLLDPENPYVPLKLGLLYEMAGRTREAIVAYRKAISLNPKNSIAHGSLGFLHLDRKEMLQAVEHLTQAVSIDHTNGYYFYGLGYGLTALGRFKEARDVLLKSIKLQPMKSGYMTLAFVTEQLGYHEEANNLRCQAQMLKEETPV